MKTAIANYSSKDLYMALSIYISLELVIAVFIYKHDKKKINNQLEIL